jgi:prepilin-type N-terminal cleavage/methylation domain-containing protein
MKSSPLEAGFTLIELLISLAILGLLLAAVVSISIGTTRSASALQARNELQSELQITRNYMASKLSQAAYVFPNGSNVQMSALGNTSVSPSGSQNWRVGTDPIVAFIIPPTVVQPGRCASSIASTAANFCYAFYAFYAMKRSDYLAAVVGANDPGVNAANDATAWVLVEYCAYYSPSATNFASAFSPTNPLTGFSAAATDIPTGNAGRLLMDYLDPGTGLATLFVNTAPPSGGLAAQTPGSTTVTMRLAALQNVVGRLTRLPSSNPATFDSLTVYPRNAGKTLSN